MLAVDFWRFPPHPEAWALLVGLVGLYWYAVTRIGPRVVSAGEAVVTRAQKRWFVLGIVMTWIAADWPMHDIAEEYLYSVHMFQHMILTFFIPPVMLLATPEWLARVVIGDGVIGRWFLKLARPIPAALVFNAIQLGSHWSGIVNASVENGLLHYTLHTLVVITALAVWMPVVSPLPELRISPPAQCIHLFLTSIVPTVPAAWLALADGTVYDASDKPARPGAGRIAITIDHLAGHNRGGIARGALHQAAPASGQVVDRSGAVQGQPVIIDDVEIGLQPRLDPAAIRQTQIIGDVRRQHLHGAFGRNAGSTGAVTGPVA